PSSPTHWKATVDEFFADLSYLINDAGPIDCVLATGDIAYSGDFQQYVRATEFFERLRSFLASQNPSVRILPIPGNHDVARPNATDPIVQLVERDHRFVVKEIQRALRTDSQNDYSRTTESTFRSFTEWSKSLGWRVGDWTPGV